MLGELFVCNIRSAVRALCRTVHIKQPRLEEASRADTIKHKLSINQSAVVINQQSTELKTG